MIQLNKFKNVFTPLLCLVVIGFVLIVTVSPVFADSGHSHLYFYENPYTFTDYPELDLYVFDFLNTKKPGTILVETIDDVAYEYHLDAGDLWDEFLFRNGYRHAVHYRTPTFYVDDIFPIQGDMAGRFVFTLPVTSYNGDLQYSEPYILFRFFDRNDKEIGDEYRFPSKEPTAGDSANHLFYAQFDSFDVKFKTAAYFYIQLGYSDVRVLDSSTGYVEKSIGLDALNYSISLTPGSLSSQIIRNELNNYEDQLKADEFGDRVDSFVGSMDSIGQVPEIDWDSFGVEDLVSSESFTNVNSFLAVFYGSAVFDKVLLALGVLILLSYIFYASKGR